MENLSISNPSPLFTSWRAKAGLAISVVGVFILVLIWGIGVSFEQWKALSISFFLMAYGLRIFIQEEYVRFPSGIRNNGVWFRSLTARGIWGWMLGILITLFYTCLYWFPANLSGLVQAFNGLSQLLRKAPADAWFVYGSLYTFAVVTMGIKFLYKYRHQRYQQIRTWSVVFFQLGFSYLLPGILVSLQQPELYFTYFWPLSYANATPDTWSWQSQTSLGAFFFFFGLFMFFIATPVLTWFFGKRWYCSWVCGCGALAETAGDPFRHLSSKTIASWKLERWMIHGILVAVVLVTFLLWLNVYLERAILKEYSSLFYKSYSFLVGAVFSGVVGVGFYPLLGSRVWCRFGCPMAAWMGIWQRKASRFRITVNGGQCISCGNCSSYCEMGIDVRAYAQRGQDIVRASCVGCGICSAVCPRGVLRLENASGDISRRGKDARLIQLPSSEVGLFKPD
jgi:polyferredoxin